LATPAPSPSGFADTDETERVELQWDLGRLGRSAAGAGQTPQLVHLEADNLTGSVGENVLLKGNAQLRSTSAIMKADVLEFRQEENRALAQGHVRIFKNGDVFAGDELNIDPDTMQGYMTQPSYQFASNRGGGHAQRIDFKSRTEATLTQANYTTCICTPQDPQGSSCAADGKPAWELRADRVDFDQLAETGYADNVQLRFMDVPILAAPSLSFPLTDKRKSGLLPPSIALDSKSGFEYTQPIYWNAAPNFDATFSPSLKTKRGLALGQEYRYLGASQSAKLQGSIMPSDRLRGRDRWGYSGIYEQSLPLPVQRSPRDYLRLQLQLQRVSDGSYWRDFSDVPALEQRLLPSDMQLDWRSDNFYARARTLKWQTQQVPESIVAPPYDRLPSLTLGWAGGGVKGLNYRFELDYTDFESDPGLTAQPNAKRGVGRAELAYALRQPGWFITPSAKWQWRDYQFKTPLASGQTHRSLSVPTLSLDAGLVFERSARFWGRDFVQTLEPRAFYTYTPWREQNDLPNYDSGQNDFNFSSIYSDNAFNGEDRVANNNLLTLGVQSRLISPSDGGELLRLAYAQRLRYTDQRIVLPGGVPDTARLSDMLFGAQAQLDPRWSADGLVQYNPKSERSERTTLGLRYHPSPYRTMSAAYRYQRGQSQLLDLGWQWPLGDGVAAAGPWLPGQGLGPKRWFSVGRVNYSLLDHKVIDALLGLEYDGGCWIGRVAVERRANTASQSGKKILFQLEFVGFSKIGASPLKALQDHVPRYQLLRERELGSARPLLNFESEQVGD
jgi:LPS-assembly protein